MNATAANLMERVLPETGLRQWVLTFPFPWRRRLAQDGVLLGKLAPGVARTLDGWAIYVGDAPVVSIPIAVCLFFIPIARRYVEVPFGPRRVVGVVWDRAAPERVAPDRLKAVGRLLDAPPMPPGAASW